MITVKAEELIRDPVFQLNLLIWTAKEQPLDGPGICVTPLFHRHGYRLFYVEQRFSFPVPIQQKLKDIEDIGHAPNADLIVANGVAQSAFYIEAKKNSFGLDSSNCRQARAHLIASGPAFGEVYPTLPYCRIVYTVPEACRLTMEPTLAALSLDVAKRGFSPGPFSVHGLAVQDQHIVYHLDEPSRSKLGSADSVVPLLRISNDGETDPSPLLLIYTDSDTYDPANRGYYRRVLIQQVHAHLLCYFHRIDPTTEYRLAPEDILMETTGGVFQYVGAETRKSMRVLIRDNVFRRIAQFWQEKAPDIFHLKGFELTARFQDDYNKERFLDWLEDPSRTKFADDSASPKEIALADQPTTEQGELNLAGSANAPEEDTSKTSEDGPSPAAN